jgi:PAS domain S-box-containing protein
MMLLDMRTIIFSYVITDIVCLAVIVLLWRQNRKHFAGMGFFVFDYALQTTALFLIILRGQIPDWMSMVLANTLAMTGALLGYMGLERFAGKKSSQIHNYVMLAAFAFVHAYFALVQPNLAARNLNLSVVLLIICLQCSWLMLYRVGPGMRQMTRGVGIVFAVYCVISVLRIVEFFTTVHLNADYLHSGIFEQFILLSNQMLFILLTYSLALMFNSRLLVEVKMGEEKFSKAFHSSPYAITITRMSDGQIIEVNDGFLHITGYQLAEVKENTTIGMHLWDKDEDRALVVSELASKGKMLEREIKFRKKSGEMITGLFSAEIIKINNENCVLSSINDITDRKWAEDTLREINQQLRLITDNVLDTIWLMDIDMRTTWISPSVVKTRGYTLAELVEMPMDKHLAPESLARAMELSAVHLTPERLADSSAEIIVSEELEYYRKDGSTFWADTIFTLLRDKEGMPSGFLGVGRDVTDRKQAESQREAALEEIQRLNTELESKVDRRTDDLRNNQLALLSIVEDLNISNKKIAVANQNLDVINKELESFSYSVSHDLRAPLRSIDGFSLALLEDYEKKLDDTGRRYLNRIRTATQHMGLLIEDMLKLSRITHAEFHHESIDLSKIVQSISETFQLNNPDKDMKLTIQEGMVITGDLNSMEIAMTNLLENAWKFTGKQKNPSIEFGMILKDEKKVFFIRDNGAGFDMAYANKLFNAFQRLHTKDFPGTGIGLATVKRIITHHGGQIWAEGEVGKGATFFFTLPE